MHINSIFRNFVVGLVAVLLPAIVLSEPTRAPRWLMNEPISLFDWGLYKIEKKLHSFTEYKVFPVHYMGGSVEYDWDADRLKLQFMFRATGTEAECVESLKKAKGAFLNFTWNEAEHPTLAREVLADLFSHQGGYKNGSQPKDIGEQLSNITILESVIYIRSANDSYSPKMRCQTTFKSKDVTVTRP